MPETFDVIVVGLGATGSATLCHLARRGVRVLGVDQFSPPHDRGSSHGRTRIYRQAYYEAPEYVPLALRALELWHELEADTGRALYAPTGGLTVGREDGALLPGALSSAQTHQIAHELLTATELARRYPAFKAPPGAIALFERAAGVLFPERCIGAHLDVARAASATIRLGERVTALHVGGADRVTLTTTRGAYAADRVVVATGAWTPALLALDAALRVSRESVHWFSPRTPHAAAGTCPVAMIEHGAGDILYTIPDFGDGFKAGLHRTGPPADVADNHIAPTADEVSRVAARVADFAPGGAGAHRQSDSCYYTSTLDGHFAIGPLAGSPGVILASACSGHGFKFASALGEALAALATGAATSLPLPLFDPARL